MVLYPSIDGPHVTVLEGARFNQSILSESLRASESTVLYYTVSVL